MTTTARKYGCAAIIAHKEQLISSLKGVYVAVIVCA